MALRMALSILLPVLAYLLSMKVYFTIILAISSIVSSIYYVFFSKNHRSSSFQLLTMVLLLAVMVLGWAKKLGAPGALQLTLALLASPLLDLRSSKLKRLLLSSPFWFFTAWAVGEIFSVRYGRWGYLLSLLIIPIVWRDMRSEEVQKTE